MKTIGIVGCGAIGRALLARSADVALDLRPLGTEAFRHVEGRGGGSASFQQGGGKGRDLTGALNRVLVALGAA